MFFSYYSFFFFFFNYPATTEIYTLSLHDALPIFCLQELFYGPYFCAEQDAKWYGLTEKVPDGPTCRLIQERAKRHQMAIVTPVYEVEQTGVYYNTAAIFDEDGSYLG